MNYFTLIKSCKKIFITILFFFSITMLFQNQTLADDGGFETRGEIQSISSDSLTVNNLTFKVDANTVVKNDDDTVIPYSQLNVGVFVEIEAVVLSDSSFLAKTINMHTEKDDIEIEGFVNSVGGSSLVVNDVTVFVDNNTVISGEEDSLKTFSDIRVGNVVNIKAVRLAGDTLLAIRIKLQTENSQDKIEIEGTINNINQDTLVVNNFNVVVDANTVIQTDEHVRLSLSELIVGQKVDIKAVLLTNTLYLARKINVDEVNGNSNQTQNRKNVYRDLARLKYLKDLNENFNACYFSMAVNENAYLNNADVTVEPNFLTRHLHTINNANNLSVFGLSLAGINCQFIWKNIVSQNDGYRCSGKFAWLTPIRV